MKKMTAHIDTAGKDGGALRAAGVIAIIASLLALYYDVLWRMALQWEDDPNYSHGFLVPFVSAYFLWVGRERLREARVCPSNLGLAVVVFGLAVLVVGHVGAELFTMRVSFLIVAAGLIIFVSGFATLRAVALPLGYLALMIPLPYIVYDAVAFPLKLFAAKSAVGVLKFFEIPVYREGNIIYLAQTTLEVADACSGIRSLMSLIALAAALAFVTGGGPVRKAALVFSAVPAAILINSARVIVTGFLADRYGEKAATGFFHEFSGMVMFGSAVVVLLGTNYLLDRLSALARRNGEKGGQDEAR